MTQKEIFNLTSHTFTQDQCAELFALGGQDAEITALPVDLQKQFSQVKPGPDPDIVLYHTLTQWFKNTAKSGDIAVIHGDWGVSYLLITLCKEMNIKALYATTQRIVIEKSNQDGSIHLSHSFKHEGFREYLSYSELFKL